MERSSFIGNEDFLFVLINEGLLSEGLRVLQREIELNPFFSGRHHAEKLEFLCFWPLDVCFALSFQIFSFDHGL